MFTRSELISLKYALKAQIRNTLHCLSTKSDEELLRKIRLMLGEKEELIKEESEKWTSEIFTKIESK